MRIIPTPKSNLGRAALQYAQEGYRVLPCYPCSKVAAISDWPRRATRRLTTIAHWWSQEPRYNIGILTGGEGPDVLDIDVRHDRDGRPFRDMLGRHGLLDGATRVVETPSGGEHWWFPGTERRKGKPAPGVDFQACGGYVLAPPSVVVVDGSLRAYRTVVVTGGSGTALVLPKSAPAYYGSDRRSSAVLGRMPAPERWLRRAPEGERNHRLYNATRWLLRDGGDPTRLRAVGISLGLGPREVDDTIASAERAHLRDREGSRW